MGGMWGSQQGGAAAAIFTLKSETNIAAPVAGVTFTGLEAGKKYKLLALNVGTAGGLYSGFKFGTAGSPNGVSTHAGTMTQSDRHAANVNNTMLNFGAFYNIGAINMLEADIWIESGKAYIEYEGNVFIGSSSHVDLRGSGIAASSSVDRVTFYDAGGNLTSGNVKLYEVTYG